MKNKKEVKPNYAPIYAAALYPKLARIFVDHGYALAVHGSLARDFDLIAVPWIKRPKKHETIFKAIEKEFAVTFLNERKFTLREHGRMAYMISVGYGECAIDLSFLPCFK